MAAVPGDPDDETGGRGPPAPIPVPLGDAGGRRRQFTISLVTPRDTETVEGLIRADAARDTRPPDGKPKPKPNPEA